MTIAELWEYCVTNGLENHEIEFYFDKNRIIGVDNVYCYDDNYIYLEGE